ncbi:MAG: class II fumarate hydratase [Planctomycetota bacterium]
MSDFRIEKDSMGEMRVPADALYGASTARAVENFPVSGRGVGREVIRALGQIKFAAAQVNEELGNVDAKLCDAIRKASQEVIDGKHDVHFPVDVFQTGSGTSSNMNANEVIANRATQILGGEAGSKLVHPNDHVNFGQSSNDVFPTALHVAAACAIERHLLPALGRLQASLEKKADEFDGIVKIGRTHLQDATPIRLGQEFSGYASQVEHCVAHIKDAMPHLCELAQGGTAVGTGINTHPEFGKRVAARLSELTKVPFIEAPNHFEAQAAQDGAVQMSATLKTLAQALIKIANDIRWLGSGPKLGLGELALPAVQPGSSIMPGKVNPVICESIIMVGAQVIGNDAAVTMGGVISFLELNTMLPLIARNLLESIELLANSSDMFVRKLLDGLKANAERIAAKNELSLSLATALAPRIGYDAATKIAKASAPDGAKTVRELAREQNVLPEDELDRVLDLRRQTEPGV